MDYRRAFLRGDLTIDSSFAYDDIEDGQRGHVDLKYTARSPQDYTLDLSLEGVRDEAYLLDYDISDQDFVRSAIELEKTSARENLGISFAHVKSLREDELNGEVPSVALTAHYERRRIPNAFGGDLRLRGDFLSQYRYSNLNSANAPAGQIGGRDTTRATLSSLWDRTWISGSGVVSDISLEAHGDVYYISQDSNYPHVSSYLTPFAGVRLSYPLQRKREQDNLIIRPTSQLVWSPNKVRAIPNEDSLSIEFDAGNAFLTSRSPGIDLRELGTRLNTGIEVDWQHEGGDIAELSVVRILPISTPENGISSLAPEWSIAGNYQWGDGSNLETRINLDDDFAPIRSSSRFGFEQGPNQVAITYVYLAQNSVQQSDTESNSIGLEVDYQLSTLWDSEIEWLFDVEEGKSREATLALSYNNECVQIGFSISRRFTASAIVEPTTTLGIEVELLGITKRVDGTVSKRTCNGI